MSKLTYIVYKNHKSENLKSQHKSILKKIENKILPDNLDPNPIYWFDENNILGAVYNPISKLKIKNTSICLGYTPNENWDDFDLNSDEIEGSFAIVRNTNPVFQIVSDMLASRTLWYYFNEEFFVVSTSQRAIVSILGGFEFNENVIPWMLSSGTLGPGFSYDKRIRMLKPNTIISLDKEKWSVEEYSKQLELKNIYKDKVEAKEKLKQVLYDTFKLFELDNTKVALPLSGGYDSRGVLLFLEDKENLKTITWGAKESRYRERNDAYIAKQLAESLNVENEFFESYKEEINIKDVLDRFLICSEGRIDHIGGYLDGMQMWNTFFNNGYETIIRGEELIGLSKVDSQFVARRDEGITILTDYINIPTSIIKTLPKQLIPGSSYNDIYRYKGELAINYEHPIIFSALNDIKLAFTEIFSPLLSASIIKEVAKMFDEDIIGDKKLFIEIVDEICPNIPIATESANKQITGLFQEKTFRVEMKVVFEAALKSNVFDKELINLAINKIFNKSNSRKKSITFIVKNILPNFIVDYIKSKSNKREMDWNLFAFRLYILIRMNDLFKEDSTIKNTTYENSNLS